MSDYIPCGNSPCVMPAGHPGPCAVSVSTGGTPPWANVSPAPLLVIDQLRAEVQDYLVEIAHYNVVLAEMTRRLVATSGCAAQVADCLGYIDAVITDRDAYEAEAAALRAKCPHTLDGACLDWERLAARSLARAEKAEADLHTAREALRAVEGWGWGWRYGDPCPLCESSEATGHEDKCPIGRALSPATEEPR